MTNSFLCSFLNSSVGKKQIMALTGLGLIGFLLGHLAGNMLLFVGADAFNFYGHKLTSNPLIYVAEAGLLAMFLTHIGLAFKLVLENNAARPQKYYMKSKTGRGSTFASSTMPYTGLIILVFVISHLMHFKYGAYYTTIVDGVEMRDLYRVVIEYFRNPIWVGWYVFAMLALGLHLSHGFQSTFQSLGINHPKYTPIIKKIGCGLCAIISIGFSVLAVYSHIKGA